jgi:hypothetical protein
VGAVVVGALFQELETLGWETPLAQLGDKVYEAQAAYRRLIDYISAVSAAEAYRQSSTG